MLGNGSQPVVDVQDHHFVSGMIGVRDYCTDGDMSISSYSNLVATEVNRNQTDNLDEDSILILVMMSGLSLVRATGLICRPISCCRPFHADAGAGQH